MSHISEIFRLVRLCHPAAMLLLLILSLELEGQMSAKQVARDHVNAFVAGGAAVAAVPIPGTSIALTVAEAKLAADIAKIYGVNPYGMVWSIILKAVMLQLGGSLVLKAVAEALNFIPVFGWLAKPAVAGTVIKGFGEALIAYWDSRFPDHEAYTKPGLTSMLSAFGETIGRQEMQAYLDSYSSTR